MIIIQRVYNYDDMWASIMITAILQKSQHLNTKLLSLKGENI